MEFKAIFFVFDYKLHRVRGTHEAEELGWGQIIRGSNVQSGVYLGHRK